MKRGRDDGAGGPGAKRLSSAGTRAPTAAQQNRLTTNDALTYLREVKNRFSDNKEVYDTFLEIMKEFKAQRIDTAGVIVRVKDLFRGHKELILGFNTFLPKGYEIQLADVEDDDKAKQPVEFDQAISYVNKIKNRFAADERVYKAFLEILNMYRKGHKTINNVYEEVAVLFRNHNDLLGEFTYFLPDSTPQPGAPVFGGVGARAKHVIKPGPPGRGPSGRMQQPMDTYTNKRKQGRGEWGDERSTLERELTFFDRVKSKLRNKDSYADLLKCLNMFAQDIITKAELVGLVQDILGHHGDLMAGFNQFLVHVESMQLGEELKQVAREGRLATKETLGRGTNKHISQRDKFLSKPLSELAADLSANDRCTTSYVRVPLGYPKLRCSGRNELMDDILNDTWISIITGSEDYSFKLMRKNQYEEALFRCEDDRYELDMCIETNASTIQALRPIADRLSELGPEDKAAFRMGYQDSHLSRMHYTCIERLYGDQGSNLLEMLRKNPAVAVPVVLMRLEQKEMELRRTREDMNKQWKRVFDQNYQKSLDHRSFYFKQSDKKNLVPRMMMGEIKEAVDKRRFADDNLKLLAAACPLVVQLQPDLEYDYKDASIHDDVFAIVSQGIEECCASDVREALMQFWTRIVEGFFCLPERQYDKKDLVAKPELERHRSSQMTKAADGNEADDDAKSDSSEDKKVDEYGPSGGEGVLTDNQATPEPEGQRQANTALEALLNQAAEAGDQTGAEDEDVKEGQPGAEDEGAADEVPGSLFALCKPLASAAAFLDHTPRLPGRVLYGNDNYYVLFRYHRYLYDRLLTERACCIEKSVKAKATAAGVKLEEEDIKLPSAEIEQEAARLHTEFMGLVHALLSSERPDMDASVFEDTCRTLLGTNSYVLFTLDKLVHKLVKHLQAMLQDEQTLRLKEMYKYEQSRVTGISDECYHLNACVVMHDENCYRLQYVKDQQRLVIQMLDPWRSELPNNALEKMFHEYVERFTGLPEGRNKRKTYMFRNLGKLGKQGDKALPAMYKLLFIRNGLECKISCSNSKVSYVLDTEDVLYRHRTRPRSKGGKVVRAARFNSWLTQRQAGPMAPAIQMVNNGIAPAPMEA